MANSGFGKHVKSRENVIVLTSLQSAPTLEAVTNNEINLFSLFHGQRPIQAAPFTFFPYFIWERFQSAFRADSFSTWITHRKHRKVLGFCL